MSRQRECLAAENQVNHVQFKHSSHTEQVDRLTLNLSLNPDLPRAAERVRKLRFPSPFLLASGKFLKRQDVDYADAKWQKE